MDSRTGDHIFALWCALVCLALVSLCLFCFTLPWVNEVEKESRAQDAHIVRLEKQVKALQSESEPSKWDKVIHNREQDLEAEVEGWLHTGDPHELHEFLDGKEW